MAGRRLFLITSACVLVLCVATAARALKRTAPTVPVAFGGWTNIAGARQAILQFPPVTARPAGKYRFTKRLYSIELELLYLNADRSTAVQSVREQVGVSSRLPIGAAQINVPVPEGVKEIQVIRAEGILKAFWDDIAPPFPPPNRHWNFNLPDLFAAPGAILNGQSSFGESASP